jgi:hypothetical protein
MSSTERQNSLLVSENWTKIYQTFQNADFKSYDFETIKRSMVEYLRQNYPENFNDYIDSSEYIALIDMIAFIAQSLSFRIDLNARENFLDTAERRDSILKLARLVSYNPKRTQTANGFLKITSVTTSENVVDSSGTNLNNKVVIWNDGTNPDWYQQFTLVMNSVMSTSIFGKPNARRNISGILSEQYNLNIISNDVPVYSFNKTVASVPMTFEIIGSNIIDTPTVSEQIPRIGSEFGVIYKNDNKGSASRNSGWFVQFKEGTLQSSDFSISNPVANEIIGVDVTNINDTDVWLYQLEPDGTLGNYWEKIESIGGNSVVYNTLKNKTKNFYSVSTRENDQIDLHFSDGVFGSLPLGAFKLYYRTSNGRSYIVTPQEMSDVQVRLPYFSKNGQSHLLTLTMSLQVSVTNSAESESNASIRENAPQTYYTQNRMITAEDYNIAPLNINQDIVKIKSVNRVASGVSRYFDLNDPTGRSSLINLFSDDGAIYRDTYTTNFTFSFNTKNEVYGIVKSKIEPLISSETVRDFYYEIFERITVGNLGVVWTSVFTVPNQTTGYFSSVTSNAAVPVSNFTQSTLKYVKSKALVKFVPPEGKFFAANNTVINNQTKNSKDYIWAEVVYVSGDGSNLGKGTDDRGIGLIGFSTAIPTGAIPAEIIPVFVTDIPFAFETEIVNQLTLRRDFGIRFDRDSSEWRIINFSNLDLDNDFSLTYSGDISNLGRDASWLVAFKSDGENYITYHRGLDYVFQSDKKINFYFNPQENQYSRKLGGVSKDNIIVLSVNEQLSDGKSLGKDFQFEITGMLSNLDGYLDNTKVKVSFSDKTGDGIVDDPDAFNNIVSPDLTDENTGFRTSFVFLKTVELNNKIFRNLLSNDEVLIFNSELDIVNLNAYQEGQLFYFYNPTENVVKRLVNSVGLILDNSIKTYVGRSNIKFQYIHIASQDYRIDPAKTNIIDIFLLTKTYDDAIRSWIIDQMDDPPPQPTSISLFESFGNDLDRIKSISDEVVFHPAKYKLLFGKGADLDLQAQFFIVKNPSSVINDNDIKSRVINSINEYFSLDNWEFGDTFNFGELSAYVIKELSPDIVNFLIVPKAPERYFGSLFQVFCESDEILLSTADVQDLQIINTVTSGLLRTNGPIVISSDGSLGNGLLSSSAGARLLGSSNVGTNGRSSTSLPSNVGGGNVGGGNVGGGNVGGGNVGGGGGGGGGYY